MKCPDQTTWVLFLDGELPPRKRASLDRHLEACQSCKDLVAGLKATKIRFHELAVLGAAPDDEVARFIASLPPRRRFSTVYLRPHVVVPAMAAALLAGIFLGRLTERPVPTPPIQTISALPSDRALAALNSLQPLKLTHPDPASLETIRDLEHLIADSIAPGEGGPVLDALVPLESAEDSLRRGDFVQAASSLGQAADLAGNTEVGRYARLERATILADQWHLYGQALSELSSLPEEAPPDAISSEAQYLIAGCRLSLGDAWGAAATLDLISSREPSSPRLAVLAAEVGDAAYQDAQDLETAQRAYQLWRESAQASKPQLQKAQEVETRLALLDEASNDDFEPLRLYLRAEKAYPSESQYLYAQLVSRYPECSLAEEALGKWYALEQARKSLGSPEETPPLKPSAGLYRTVAESDAPEEIRAYARLKLADHLHAQLDGVEEVLVAYRDVARDYPWTEAAYLARTRADRVRDAIETKEARY